MLEKFTTQLDNSQVIDNGSLSSLYTQAYAMKQYAERNKKLRNIAWHFSIEPDKPIAFKEAESCPGIRPDIFCTMDFSFGEIFELFRMNTVIRLWSTTQSRAYRIKMDSESIEKKLQAQGWKRVMLRMHFDFLPKSAHAAPVFHMQFGGRHNDAGDLCWFPTDIDVPRILTLPVDFFGGCEIIMANFFPSHYFDISEEGNWRKSIKWCETQITKNELTHHLRSIESDESVFRRSISDKRN